MIDQFARQAEQFLNAARDGRVPETVQAFATEAVAKSREAFDKASSGARDQAKVAEELVLTGQAGVKAIGSKVLENTLANTEAAFEAAQTLARARSLPEAAKAQADFVMSQFNVAGAQTKELFDLSTRVAQQTFDALQAATTQSMDRMRKSD